MSDEATPASAVGSPVVDAIRSLVPEFEEAFRKEFEAEGPGMGAFQAMSLFAEWLGSRIEQSPDGTDVRRAFWVVEEIAVEQRLSDGRFVGHRVR